MLDEQIAELITGSGSGQEVLGFQRCFRKFVAACAGRS
jgi:hypothetical protein